MASIANGDAQALSQLYDQYGRIAYRLAYRMLGDQAVAEDAVQEAFLAIWRHASGFDASRGSARVWILTLVRHHCIDTLRGSKAKITLDPSIEESLPGPATDEVWDGVARTLEAQDVRRALDQLPEAQRATIDLAYYGGLTQAQIAGQMQVPLGTVKGRMRLALARLRELLTGGGLEPASDV